MPWCRTICPIPMKIIKMESSPEQSPSRSRMAFGLEGRYFPATLCLSVVMLLAGCVPKVYRFSYPREDQPVSGSFVPSSDYLLPGSPAPEIALYNVTAGPGRNRMGVICYVATYLESAVDPSGPKVWKRRTIDAVEYEVIATPAIDRDKYKKLLEAIEANTPGF